jgi:hypothetical protein
MMTKHELIETAYELTGGNAADLTIEQLRRLTDICLNEIERRGELETRDGVPIPEKRTGRKAMPPMNRVEKVNMRKKYRFAKVYYKTGEGEDAKMHSRSNGRTPLQWVRWAFAEAERRGKEFYRMGGYFEEQ